MGLKFERKRILIYYMPMENIHFVIHESIDGFLKDRERDEVAGSVDEQTAVLKQRLVLNFDRQSNHIAISVFFVARNRLQKGFERPHKSDVMVCFDFGVRVCDIQLIRLLFCFERTSQRRVCEFDPHFVLGGFFFFFRILVFNNQMSIMAIESRILLMLD